MSFKKKSAVYSVAALMLCVAVYLNWSYNKTDDGEYSSAAEFENAKMLGEAALVDSSQETKEISGRHTPPPAQAGQRRGRFDSE